MQTLLASLVIGMEVRDTAFKSGMATARAEAKRTGQDFERAGGTMAGAIDRAAHEVNAAAVRMVDGLANAGRKARDIGAGMVVGLTLPLGLAGKAAKDTASDFQSSMNRVRSAMLSADPDQIDRLRQAALTLGPAMGKSAIEAADAIEMLAKNGMSAADILGGGLASALKLGVLGQASLSDAADLTTDVMQQFGKSSADLPVVVDRITGALDASKMSFNDYRLAAGQAGGLVGALGYSFEDFNTALAATSPLFDSGSDAGTSFRSFLTSLNAKGEDAERTMTKLGLSFYEADGRARPLAQIADELQRKMSHLSDRSKNAALSNIFGVDGARTALALMKPGLEGVEDAREKIAAVTADQKLAILLDGEAAATQRVASAWERLKISVGEAGLIQAFTLVKEAAAGTLAIVGSAPPWFFKLAVAAGLTAAAIGPLTLATFGLAKIALPLLLLRLGPVALGFAAILNPAGVLLRILGQLALQAGTATVIGRLGTALIGLAGPIGLVVSALTILYPLIYGAVSASAKYATAQGVLSQAQAQGASIALQLATATGKAKDEALSAARANRTQAASAVAVARADLQAARAASLRARAMASTPVLNPGTASALGPLGVPIAGASRLVSDFFGRQRLQAAVDQKASAENLGKAIENFDAIDKVIRSAEASTGIDRIDMSFDKPDREKKDRKGSKGRSADDIAREAAQAEARYQDDLGQSRVAQLRAQAELTDGVRARYTAEMGNIAEERASYIRQNATDEDLTDAKRAALLLEKDRELATRRAIAEQNFTVGLAQEEHDMARAVNEAQQEMLRAQIDLADNAGERRAGELRLLDLQRRQEDADLDLILATKATASAEWENANRRKGQLDAIYTARAEQVTRQNEAPGAAYMRELNRSAGAIGEDIEAAGTSALKDLNSDLTEAVLGTKRLGDAFESMGRRILASIIEIGIQQRVIRPFAESLFGQGGGGGGWLGGLAGLVGLGGRSDSALGASIAAGANGALAGLPSFGGFRAAGGSIEPNKWYMVGERGPEPFFSGTRGTMLPNAALGASGRRQASVVQLVVGEGQVFEPRVQAISGDVSVQTVRASHRTSALRARQQLG